MKIPDECTIELGTHGDLDIDLYHRSPALSKSGLDQVAKSIDHYGHYKENGIGTTAALRIGSAAHAAILEPELFQRDYIDSKEPAECADMNWRYRDTADAASSLGEDADAIGEKVGTKPKTIKNHLKRDDVKALIEHFEKFPPGSVPEIDASELETALRCRDAVLGHPVASKMLTDGIAEQSHFWIDEGTGLKCRCRPDYRRHDGLMIDIKTTGDATPGQFQRSLWNWRYYVQAPFYLDGHCTATGETCTDFVFIVVEKAETAGVKIYHLDQDAIDRGRDDYRADLRKFAEYAEGREDWTGYPTEIETISLPPWA